MDTENKQKGLAHGILFTILTAADCVNMISSRLFFNLFYSISV